MNRNWHFFNKSDLKALFVLLIILLILILAMFFYNRRNLNMSINITKKDSILIDEFDKKVYSDSIKKNKYYEKNHYKKRIVKTFDFNPNTCDSLILIQLGLPYWVVHNAMKYRSKGGRWKSASDFKRLYGLKDDDYRRLYPHIKIKDIAVKNIAILKKENSIPRLEKFSKLVKLDLNQVDTIELKKIPGVGHYYANAIYRYRTRLGGYYNVHQLQDLQGLPDDIEQWFYVEPSYLIHQIDINKASFKELVRHPYLNYEQTLVIVNHIRKYGPLHSWNDLSLSKAFTANDFQRLSPYFYFSK